MMLHCILGVHELIYSGKFPVEKMRGAPLDMHQFSRVFGMTRVPGQGADSLVQARGSRHILVLRKGRTFTLPLFTADGRQHSLDELQSLVGAVVEMADGPLFEAADAPPISVLTSMERDAWAETRSVLQSNPTNCNSLAAVEEALFCLALDDSSPADKQEVGQLALCGTGRNRWYDKALTLIVFENGRSGMNCEHTPVDAMTITSIFLKVIDRASALLSGDPAVLQRRAPPLPARCSRPVALGWEVDAKLAATLEVASADIGKLADNVELRVLQFRHFGKGLIKRAKLHPDFFMQMAIQLAYFRLHHKSVATYETGHTRAFYHGRTDTVRTLSLDSQAFVRAMCSPAVDAQSRYAALRTACQTHAAQVERVLTGQGIDRHLLGLYIVAALQGETPALFSDKAYKLTGGMGNYVLSTSNVGYTPMFGGFSPMTADGYGVCYAMLEGRLNMSITTWRDCAATDAKAMANELCSCLCEMMRLCVDACPTSSL